MGSGLGWLHLDEPAGCETVLGLVAWVAGAWDRRAPNRMVRWWVCRFILVYCACGRSVADLEQDSTQRGCLQLHETCVPTEQLMP